MWWDFTKPNEQRNRGGKRNKFVPLDLNTITTPSKPVWGGPLPSSMTTPIIQPALTTYIGPPLTHGPIPGTELHLQHWIEDQVTKTASWCNAINGGGYPENQGPSYPHVVSPVVYQTVCAWWESKGSVNGPNRKSYLCGWTEPSEKGGRTLQVGAQSQGNIIAYVVGSQETRGGSTTHQGQTRLNLHVDIAG